MRRISYNKTSLLMVFFNGNIEVFFASAVRLNFAAFVKYMFGRPMTAPTV